jgi:RNA polymerase sigma-70 factor (ECF subfamily)
MADSEDASGASGAPDNDDEMLMARVAAGDREAFAALYRRRRPDVFRFALLMSGSTSVADDVAQDVFMEVIRHAARYQPNRSSRAGVGGVIPWLLGITRNHVLRSRHRQRFVVPLEEADPATDVAVTPDPLAGIARQQYVAALRRALLALPVKYREAIVLCDLQEMTYADAAASLRCAIGTVRSRLHRGRAMLATRMTERGTATMRSKVTPGAPAPRSLARWML